MATYNKRGYKAPKPKDEKLDNDYIENVNVDEKDSTTASVFNSLDETASKTEEFVAKNQKVIFGAVFIIALLAVAYLLYQKFVVDKNEETATNEMFQAQKYFQQATEGVKPDSLYNLALKGGEGKFGFISITENYSGTKAANLATYYAGLAYLNTGKFDEAITYLEKFKSDDVVLKAMAVGAVGDAHAEKNQMKEALDFYIKASDVSKNEYTRPRFLLKAGKTALELNNKADALKYFNDIKDNFDSSQEAQGIDALIGLAQ